MLNALLYTLIGVVASVAAISVLYWGSKLRHPIAWTLLVIFALLFAWSIPCYAQTISPIPDPYADALPMPPVIGEAMEKHIKACPICSKEVNGMAPLCDTAIEIMMNELDVPDWRASPRDGWHYVGEPIEGWAWDVKTQKWQAANALTGESILFGDGWLSEWRAARTEAKVERAVIRQQLESLKSLFDGKFTEFINAITGLVKWLVVLAVVALVTYIFSTIRQAFLAVAIVCLFSGISVAQEPERSYLTRDEAKAVETKIPGGPNYSLTSQELEAINVLSGQLEPAQQPYDVRPSLIVYLPDYACAGCDRWKLEVMPTILKKGHQVIFLMKSNLPSAPWFFVQNKSKKWITVKTGLSLDQFKTITEGK